MDFNGGGGIVGMPGIPPPAGQPVYLAQNQANLNYVNAVNQASLNPNTLYGPGGYGAATDYYSAQGAAYGRATGYYGDPYSSTPVSPTTGAGYADRSTLSPDGQAYYDAHVARYGAPPDANNPNLSPAGPPAGPPAPPAPPAPEPPAPPAYSPGGSNTPTDPGEGAAVDFNGLNAQQQAYYNAHVSKYNTAPGANNSTLMGMADSGGPSSGGGAGTQFSTPFTPSGPVASDPYSGGGHPTDPGEGAALDPSTWNDAQKAYANGHILKYGTLPGANNATMRGLADAPPMQEAPPSSPGGLIPGGGGGGGAGYNPAFGTVGGGGGGFSYPTDPGEGAALDPSTWNDAQKAYAGAHGLKYGTLPGADNATMRSLADAPSGAPVPGLGGPFQGAPGDAGQSPGMAPGMGGFSPAGFRTDPGEGAPVIYENLNPQQQAYYQAHYEKYGTAPGANNATLSGMATPTTGSGSGIDAINRAAGIDPSTGNEYPPGVDRNTGQPFIGPPSPPMAPGEGGALQFAGNPVNPQQPNPQQPDFYRSPEQSYTQFQTANPLVWQQAIPNNDPTISNAIYAAAGNMGVSPAALAALFEQESSFNPKSSQSGNYGVPQMSANQWKDAPFNGTIGGLTFDQYQNQATPAQQIAAYADWMVRSGNLTKSGMSGVGDQSPEMQAAILQAINIAPNSLDWRTGLVGGNMSTQTGPPQGGNFNDTSIGAMEDVFRQKMLPWRH